jgi:GlpG protein
VLLGVISNVAQYLMSGPYFVGFSGIVVGLAVFIWARQQNAPWEGYPLPRSTFLFLLLFVAAMMLLDLLSFLLQLFQLTTLPLTIANTAHVVGGLAGLALGKWNFFSKRKSAP